MLRDFIPIFAATVALAAPGPKEKSQNVYFPTAVEATKTYVMTFGGEVSEVVETVNKVEKKVKGLQVTVSRKHGEAPAEALIYAVSGAGVSCVRNETEEYPEPVPMLKLSAKPGDTWTWEKKLPGGKGAVTMKYTMGKEEDVEVPAGKFRAMRVESRVELLSRNIVSTHWYAPGVGLVKMVSTSGGIDRTQVLKSYSAGK